MTKKVIALFDVDGTLTVPRQQIVPGMILCINIVCIFFVCNFLLNGWFNIKSLVRNGAIYAKIERKRYCWYRWWI